MNKNGDLLSPFILDRWWEGVLYRMLVEDTMIMQTV